MMRLVRVLVTLIGIVGTIAFAAAEDEHVAADHHVWKTYTNLRFAYEICYPEDLLIPQGEADNGDGQKFVAKEDAQLIVYGSNNALDESLENDFNDTAARLAGSAGKVTYKVLKANWYVVSGQNGQTVFCAKTRYSGDQFKSFELTYDQSAAPVYEPVIRRLATCFADLKR
jgi:hypothetical protein